MRDFTLMALTSEGEWFPFSIEDIPCPIDSEHFVLLAREGTPILSLALIRRAYENLAEGDILQDSAGTRWLVCYERGFYAIDAQYRMQYLKDCADYKKVGNCLNDEFPIVCSFKRRHIFKADDKIFCINNIVGKRDDHILIRGFTMETDVKNVHQECCLVRNNKRVFFGDIIDDGVVTMHSGRICLYKESQESYTDIMTGGVVC